MIKDFHATPTISSGTAYASLDAVGGKMEFEDVCTPYSNSGLLRSVHIIDKGKQNAKLHLILFSEDFTATADNDPFDPLDADLTNIIDVILINNWLGFNDNSIGQVSFTQFEMNTPFELVEGGTSIFGQLMVETSTPTYTSTSDLTAHLVVER